jgi:hypothetical protein
VEFRKKDEVKEEGKRILKNMFLTLTDEQKRQNHNDTILKAKWENIIMANYEIDPAILRPLPKESSLTCSMVSISLVGFMFKDTKLFNVTIPWFGTLKKLICVLWFEKREIQSNAALSLSMKRFRIPLWLDG